MRIALINVQCLEGNNIVPPLGLLMVAAQLERDGHSIRAFDIDPDEEDIISSVTAFNPSIIGLGFLTNTYDKAKRLLAKLKISLPYSKTVLGGAHSSSVPLETFKNLRPDYLIAGEGEITMSRLCKALERDITSDLSNLDGLYYWRNEAVSFTGPPAPIEHLDELPFPARRLLDFKRYLTSPGIMRGYAMDKMTTIITSRGCPYPCSFCASNKVFGRKIRNRSVGNVIAEIRLLSAEYGVKGFYICDDLFTSNSEWVFSFCEALLKEPVKYRWACQSRVDTLSSELARAMRESGCAQIDFGVESGSTSTLEKLNKKTLNDNVVSLFRMLKETGIRSCATFIIGNPDETEKDIEDTYGLAKSLKADFTVFYYSTPYPGTSLHTMALDKGWLDNKAPYSSDWNHRQASFPLMDAGIGREKLAALRRSMQNHFYFRNYFNIRNLIFLASVFYSSLLQPLGTIKAVKTFFPVGRLDDLVEGLLINHRRRVNIRTMNTLDH